MAKKSKESGTFYPFSDPKHCRKPQQEGSPSVDVSNLTLILRVDRIPEEGVYIGQQHAIYSLPFVHERQVRATRANSRLTRRVLPLEAMYTIYTGYDHTVLCY